jgi:phosphosulfolactate synthase (CoM biosynthesis protein A)
VPLSKRTGTKTHPTASLLAKPTPRNINFGSDRFAMFNKKAGHPEGVTENVSAWRTDVVARSADPPVFEWYVKNYGNEVNLFVDHSQIVQFEALRSGI